MSRPLSGRLELPDHVWRPGETVAGALLLDGQPDPRWNKGEVELRAFKGSGEGSTSYSAGRMPLVPSPQWGVLPGRYDFRFPLPPHELVTLHDQSWSVQWKCAATAFEAITGHETITVAPRPDAWTGLAHTPPVADARNTVLELRLGSRSCRPGDTLSGTAVITPQRDLDVTSVLVHAGWCDTETRSSGLPPYISHHELEIAPAAQLRAGTRYELPFGIELPTGPPTAPRAKFPLSLLSWSDDLAKLLDKITWPARIAWYVEVIVRLRTSSERVRVEIHVFR